jgi:hypothetical protein
MLMSTDQQITDVFSLDHRHALLGDLAGAYIETAITNAVQEYPHMAWIVATGPESYRTHRELHPAFYGSFDWHSCVEMHWTAVRLLRLFPGLEIEDYARQTLSALLTAEHIAQEADFIRNPGHRSFERPYGWGWLLMLWQELEIWDDPDGRFWATTIAPLAHLIMDRFEEWLPKMTYPQRIGMHANTAFGLSLAWSAVEAHRPELMDTFRSTAMEWFGGDVDYPAHYEPSGADFLSAALCEAELMSRVLPDEEFPGWLDAFLPGLERSSPVQLFTPAIVTDATDGQIAHLHGLNLSRAWAFIRLAQALPEGDPRAEPLLAAAGRHADASLGQVVGGDYMTEHWLAAYATLLLSG